MGLLPNIYSLMEYIEKILEYARGIYMILNVCVRVCVCLLCEILLCVIVCVMVVVILQILVYFFN